MNSGKVKMYFLSIRINRKRRIILASLLKHITAPYEINTKKKHPIRKWKLNIFNREIRFGKMVYE